MRKTLPNWERYWAKYNNPDELEEKLNQLDDTLKSIELEFDCKLLSGDQMELVDALEERLELLQRLDNSRESDLQISLFD